MDINIFEHAIFSLTHPEEETWPGGMQPMLLPESCCVCMLSVGSWVQMFFQITIFVIFSLTHPEEEVWPDGTQPVLFPESSGVCIPSFAPVASRVWHAKVPFLFTFYRHD